MDKMNFVHLGDASSSDPEYWLAGKNTLRITIGHDTILADGFDGTKAQRLWKLDIDQGPTKPVGGTIRRLLASGGRKPVGNWPKEALAAIDAEQEYAVYKFSIGAGGMQGWLLNRDGTSSAREDIPSGDGGRVKYAITRAERNLLGWK